MVLFQRLRRDFRRSQPVVAIDAFSNFLSRGSDLMKLASSTGAKSDLGTPRTGGLSVIDTRTTMSVDRLSQRPGFLGSHD